MKQGNLYITICPNDDMFEKIEVLQNVEEDMYDVRINTTLAESFFSLICDEKNINDVVSNIEDIIEFRELISTEFYENVLNQCKEEGFFSSASRLYINGIYEDVVEYLIRNPELLTKEIILNEVLDIDKDTYLRVKEVFKDYPNIKFMVSGNDQAVSLSDYEKTIDSIDAIVSKIKQYNYSPLEQLILAYDLIRDRFYVQEDETEDYSVSRDLTSSLLGDKIVCVGFANIFNIVCKKLGINSMVFSLSNNKDVAFGHARDMVYLEDQKYKINGIYFFDPTFDCKRDEKNNFLLSYRFFGKNYQEMDKLCFGQLVPETFKIFAPGVFSDLIEKCEEVAESNDFLAQLHVLRGVRLNSLLSFVGKDNIRTTPPSMNFEEIISALYELKNLSSQSMGAECFLKALYVVRKNQYYENPTKYMFDLDALIKIMTNSRFIADDSPELRILAAIGFSQYNSETSTKKKVIDFVTKNELDIDMERVKLSRTLRTLLQVKTEDEQSTKKL